METIQSIHILQTLDRLISEMNTLRSQVIASLENPSSKTVTSIREAEYFGLWANREDMAENSSRAWLEQLRSTQWSRS
jgi:hypothetical protein